MNNPRLMGIRRADNFNLKGSMCVVAMYGVITIISYFNELNKAGLLKRGAYPQPLSQYRFDKSRIERSIDLGSNIIQKNGDIHSLGLEILKIKKDSKHKGTHGHEGEINIKVLLGKNGSYEKINNSVIHVYDHKNTLPNFYTSLNMTLLNISASKLTVDNVTLIPNLSSVISEAESKRQAYRKATLVYMYQHEPDSYLIRDCLKNISQEKNLAVNNLPLSSKHRKQWEVMSRHKKRAFHILYGGLSFGVCETVGRPCNYLTLVSHPLDRLVALYRMCRPPMELTMKSLCRMNNIDRRPKSLREFIISQGSGFFQKLVYYAKHCRLIGEDEICLQDSRTSFVFTPKERELHLEHVLQHLEVWFGVVGLVEKLSQSLDLFQKIYGHTFPKCYNNRLALYKKGSNAEGGGPAWLHYLQREKAHHKSYLSSHERKQLLNDSSIAKALAPDIAIYDKLVEIYNKQTVYKKALDEYKKSVRFLSAKQRELMKKMRLEIASMKTNVTGRVHGEHGVPNASLPQNNSSLAVVTKSKHLVRKHGTNTLSGHDLYHKNGTSTLEHSKHKTTRMTKKYHSPKSSSGKDKLQTRKRVITTNPVAGMDALLYQNYSFLEKSMSDGEKKNRNAKKLVHAHQKHKIDILK